MSIVQLVSRGAQDVYFTDNDNGHSPFRTRYERHTNFSQGPKLLGTIGSQQTGNTTVIPLNPLGDLVNAVWFEGENLHTRLPGTVFELWIGGQLIDSQTWEYINDVWQVYMADTWSKATAINNAIAHADNNFLPLHFFFCEHNQFLPICALSYHQVEIRVTWGPSVGSGAIYPYANYVWLDTQERKLMIHSDHVIPITQVQCLKNNLDLSNFNHPIKAFFFGTENSGTPYTFDHASLYLNGQALLENMSPTYFHTVQGYYRGRFSVLNFVESEGSPLYTNFFMYSFATDVTEYVSKGSCNMSRIDSAVLKIQGAQPTTIYGVNYQILRIKKGMGGLLFAN